VVEPLAGDLHGELLVTHGAEGRKGQTLRTPRGVLIVFAKAPRPGLVKTRLSPPLSPEQAAELYTHLLDDVLEATAHFARRLALDAVVALHPAEACAEIASRVPGSFRVIAQRGFDLSDRMTWAVAEAAAGGATRILLRGSDNPVMTQQCVETTLHDLDTHDLVISPDHDGGYGMIGLRRPAPGLFDHPMSTGTVLEDTIANAGRLGLKTRLLEPSFDIDTVQDFAHLRRARASGGTGLCPRTIAYLDEGELWRFGSDDLSHTESSVDSEPQRHG
jgi:rSAM/selenodomain-associated transferase 1